jgi:hypothetical protein
VKLNELILLHYWERIQYILYTLTLGPSDGTLNGAPCQGSQHPWQAKDRFPDFRKRVGSLGPSGKLKISNPKNITVSIILTEVLCDVIILACLSIEIESAAG